MTCAARMRSGIRSRPHGTFKCISHCRSPIPELLSVLQSPFPSHSFRSHFLHSVVSKVSRRVWFSSSFLSLSTIVFVFRHIPFDCRIFINYLVFVKHLVVLQNLYFPGLVGFCVFITWLFLFDRLSSLLPCRSTEPNLHSFLSRHWLDPPMEVEFRFFFAFRNLEVIHHLYYFIPLLELILVFFPCINMLNHCSPVCCDYFKRRHLGYDFLFIIFLRSSRANLSLASYWASLPCSRLILWACRILEFLMHLLAS